jgi:ATP-dependent Zn protease
LASNIIRVYGMKDTIGRIDTEGEHTFWITSLAETDNKVEQILANAMERTKKLIIENKGMLAAITDKLIEGETITHAQMNQMFIENGYTMFEEEVRIQYQTMYQHFKDNV